MLSRPLGDMQRGAWATDSNVKFINVVVVGVTHMDQLAQGGKKTSLGLLECGIDKSQSFNGAHHVISKLIGCSVQGNPHCNSSSWD